MALVAQLPMHSLVVPAVALLKQGQVVLARLIKVLLVAQATQVVLVLLGYEAAETDVVERVESLLGENFDNNNRIRADLGLRRYMALAKNAVAASVIDYMARKTGMSKRQAEILLEKHVEGRKKSDASGSNAGHVRLPGGRSAGIFDE